MNKFNSMRSLQVIIALLLAMIFRCYGNTTDNCTTFPAFTSYAEYSPAYHCYMYPLPPVYYHQPFDMTVNVSEDDVILTWFTQEDGILKCRHYPCEVYTFTADNRTLTWLNPNMSKVFYVNVTNRCGKGNATACFKVVPLCQICSDCDKLPGPTNNSIEVAEHSDPTFHFTIKGEVFTRMYWSFVRPDHSNSSCYCDAESEDKLHTECDVPNWKLQYYHDNCYLYTCTLTIRNVSMNYTDGMLISTAASSPENIKNVSYTRIFVIRDNDKHKSTPTLVYYCFTGVIVAIVVCVIFMMICVIYMKKRRCRWPRSYDMYEGYESIPSPSPFEKAAPVPINDKFYGDDNDDDDDVRSCDLENIMNNTPPKNV